MLLRVVACALPLTIAVAPLAQAIELVKAQPERHVLLYFDMSQHCLPRAEVRALLNSGAVREQWRRNDVVLSIDLCAPAKEDREAIEQLRVSWAPVLVLLDLLLDTDNMLQASGQSKDGAVSMKGTSKWYVTKKGKLCLELNAGEVDEGYYVSKNLRPKRQVYRFVLAAR